MVLDHAEREADHGVMSLGNGGWVRYQTSRRPGLVLYRRYADRDGRLAAVEMYLETIDETTVLGAEFLRSIDLGRVDAWANGLAEQIRAAMGVPAPDLRRAARHFGTRWGTRGGKPRRPHWVADMYWAQVPGSGVPQPPLPKVEPLEEAVLPAVDVTLDVPPARPYGDAFYRQVADIYRELAPRTRAVASVIADANHVEVTQVHRWVKVARQKGFLSPTTRGKVG